MIDEAIFALDELAGDGVYCCSDDSEEPGAIDIRMVARMTKELKPGEVLSEEQLQECIESYHRKKNARLAGSPS